MRDADRELLDEQIRYYRARAADYDTTTTPDADPYAPAANRIRSALRAARPIGRVLQASIDARRTAVLPGKRQQVGA